MAKYELLTNDTITINGHKLFRIKALKDFNDVKKGALGGYIESENNLSQEEYSWVYSSAKVYSNARVFENAQVYGEAHVFGNATVCGEARVYNNAQVFGNSQVYDTARIYNKARVFDNVLVYNNARVYGTARVYNKAQVFNNAEVYENGRVYDSAKICGYAEICGNTQITGLVTVKRNKQVLTIGSIGLRDSAVTFVYDSDNNTIYVTTGRFHNTIDEFVTQVKNRYGNNVYARTYLQAVDFVKTYFQTVFKNKQRL